MDFKISDTSHSDLPYIREFFTDTTTAWFGPNLNLPELIEKSFICLSQRGEGDEPLSVICLDDYPPVPSILRDFWLEWMREVYQCSQLRYKNSVFIHLLAWSSSCASTFLEHLLSFIYQHYHAIDHIILVIPQDAEVDSFVLNYFLPMQKTSSFKNTRFSLPLFVNSRSWTVPEIEIRPAEIEHADYIMELLAQKQPDVKATYARQMIDELYEPEDTDYRIRLVALKEDVVVAFIILDTRVDHDLLQDVFDLTLYGPSSESEMSEDSIRPESSSSYTTVTGTISHRTTLMGSPSYVAGAEEMSSAKSGISAEDSSVPSKVFAIAVFAVDSRHEYVIPALLDAAFRTYCPDCTYAVLSAKSDQTSPLFKFMNQILTKEQTMYPYELYALSKAAVLGNISVRASIAKDAKDISWLLKYYEDKDTILEDVFRYLNCPDADPAYKMVTICVDNHYIIGFAMIYLQVESMFIDSHFHIQDTCDYKMYHHHEQGLIKYFILSPPFLKQGRFIVKEILRLLNISCLLYSYYRDSPLKVIPEIIKIMLPIKPRILMEYPPSDLNGNIPAELILKRESPSSLYLINKRMTSLVHATNHARVVVVGASPIAISFLETLIFDRTPADPCFTRLSLITKHGMWQQAHKHQALAESMLVNTGLKVFHYVACLGFSMWVTIRLGTFTEIKPREKHVTMNYTEYKMNYEYLFIVAQLAPKLDSVSKIMNKAFGDEIDEARTLTSETDTTRRQAYTRFTQQSKNISHRRCEANLKVTTKLQPAPLENVFCIANIVDAGQGIDYVEQLVETRDHIAPILIIGKCLAAVACVHTVLALGCREAGYEIILIEPWNVENTNTRYCVLNNIDVSRAMIQQLNENKVTLVRHVRVFDYGTSTDHVTRVAWVRFESEDSMLFTLKCSAVFVFQPVGLEEHLYYALNVAKILVQQKILINSHYQTNEPAVYAAGTGTRYVNRLFADADDTKYFNPLEIGEDLGKQFKQFLASNCRYQDEELPKFKRCLVEGCILPGGYNYLHVYRRGKKMNQEYFKSDDHYEIKTGKILENDSRGYFQLLFDKFKFVIEITCVTRGALNIGNTIALYGKHAGLLNNILERHAASPIPDLYTYFEQSWSMAIYYDKFNDFLTNVAALFNIPNEDKTTLRGLIETIKRDHTDTPERSAEAIRQAFAEFQILKKDLSKVALLDILVKKTVAFLDANADYLPMYATLGAIDKTLLEDRYPKSRRVPLDETCCNFGIPDRGYHLPRTEPLSERELECLLMTEEDISDGASTTRDERNVEILCPEMAFEGPLSKYFQCDDEKSERDVLSTMKEKKMKKHERMKGEELDK